MSALHDLLLSAGDALLGWLLTLPRDVVLIAIALGSGAVLTGVRRFTTDQDLLRRCRADRRRLRQLLRKARRRGDREAVRRHRALRARVARKAARQEVRPLLAALVPIAFLATWAFQRVAYVPPAAGEPVRATLWFPVSAAGRLVHLVPEAGLTAEGGWVREIRVVPDAGRAYALARWTLRGEAPAAYDLRFRYRRRTYRVPLRIGGRFYAPPVRFFDDGEVVCAEVDLREARLFGVVPGIRAWGIQPWLVAYFLVAIPGMVGLTRLFGVC